MRIDPGQHVERGGFQSISEAVWMICGSHTLESLRIIWEHARNTYTWVQPPGDADSVRLELGPTTCVFITSLGGVLKQGAQTLWRWLRSSRSNSAPVSHPDSWPLCLATLFWTLTLLYLCLWALCSALILLFCGQLWLTPGHCPLQLWFLLSAVAPGSQLIFMNTSKFWLLV